MTLEMENRIGLNYPVGLTPPNAHITWRSVTKGWPGAGFKSQDVEARIRRVQREDTGDELQVELQIDTHHEKASRSVYGSLILNGDQIATLLAHIDPQAGAALAFVHEFAAFTRDGEFENDGEPNEGKEPWDQTGEDAIDTVDSMIRKARGILGLELHNNPEHAL